MLSRWAAPVLTLFPLLAGAQWTSADPPAQPSSGMPFFTAGPTGEIYISWTDAIEPRGHALRWSKWTGSAWTAPETAARGDNWFFNWADFPSLAVLPDGSMLAHWLERAPGGGKYGYGIRVARRAPGAQGVWTPAAAMNEKDEADYAGFLSFAGGTAAYLAPPEQRPAVAAASHDGHDEHIKTLRFIRFERDGRVADDRQIDADVCSCCQTATAATKSGLLVAYRDHLPGEIRDISIVRLRNGKWSEPRTLHRDGWKINGCPTEGPSIALSGDSAGIAWVTRADGIGRVQVALSTDGGETFRAPIRGDDGDPVGRPNFVALDGKQSLLAWIERTGDGAEIRVRRVYADGTLAPSMRVAKVSPSRATGLPKLAIHDGRVLAAWRDGAVRAAWLPAGEIPKRPE